jgi:hypothetical protein
LYENQASHLINESSSTADSGSFETVVFPIIRRVFSKLLANEIVSVQAMNLDELRALLYPRTITMKELKPMKTCKSSKILEDDHIPPEGLTMEEWQVISLEQLQFGTTILSLEQQYSVVPEYCIQEQ